MFVFGVVSDALSRTSNMFIYSQRQQLHKEIKKKKDMTTVKKS
jgi:hypothetical protein